MKSGTKNSLLLSANKTTHLILTGNEMNRNEKECWLTLSIFKFLGFDKTLK